MLSETAVFLLLASRADDGRHHAAIRHLAQRLAPHARCRAAGIAIAASPSRACWLGLAHVALSTLGLADARFDVLLRRTLASPSSEACELEPHRILESRWVCSLLDGGRIRHDDLEHLGVLGNGIDAVTGATSDAYALSHALFYATDFGRLPLTLERSPAAVLTDVEAALAAALDADDLDLTGELLMAPALLRTEWSPILRVGWGVLDALWTRWGTVPSLGFDVDGYRTAVGQERGHIVLRDTYHTVYVAGLLCATLIATDLRPPASLPTAPPSAVCDRWLRRLADQRPRSWLEVVQSFEADQRAAALPLVLDVAARRRALAGDVLGLAEVLQDAVEHGLSERPTPNQTAQFLDRLLVAYGEHA